MIMKLNWIVQSRKYDRDGGTPVSNARNETDHGADKEDALALARSIRESQGEAWLWLEVEGHSRYRYNIETGEPA